MELEQQRQPQDWEYSDPPMGREERRSLVVRRTKERGGEHAQLEELRPSVTKYG